jgi:hypothetical protein
MDLLEKDELRKLIEKPEAPCVSIYMPTHRMFPETKQDPIRFKNLLREAEARLKAAGLRSPDAKRLLKPAKALIKDGLFWQYQADGLAMFVSPGLFYHHRLPLKFDELLVVTDRFHVKPLLPLFSDEGRFYILALSQNEVRFFQCTPHSVEEVELENLPRSLSEALPYDDPEKQLQFHTRAPAAGGERAAMFHGHGVGKDDAKDNILRFFRQVDDGLRPVLSQERVPLLLAGVDYLHAIYREANRYPYLTDQGITGNPEGLKGEKLHEQAWGILEPHFLKGREEAMAQYRQLAGGVRASKDLKQIAPAAYEGRVDLLFVAVGVQGWGFYDSETRTVHLHTEPEPVDEDLLDFAAIHTFLNGGTVYALKPEEMPDEAPLAAVFRY